MEQLPLTVRDLLLVSLLYFHGCSATIKVNNI